MHPLGQNSYLSLKSIGIVKRFEASLKGINKGNLDEYASKNTTRGDRGKYKKINSSGILKLKEGVEQTNNGHIGQIVLGRFDLFVFSWIITVILGGKEGKMWKVLKVINLQSED